MAELRVSQTPFGAMNMAATFNTVAALALRFCADRSGAAAIEYVVISTGMALTLLITLQRVGNAIFNEAEFHDLFPAVSIFHGGMANASAPDGS